MSISASAIGMENTHVDAFESGFAKLASMG
jgi:hypothetical protein